MDRYVRQEELALAEHYFEEGKNNSEHEANSFEKASEIFLKYQVWEKYIFCLYHIAKFCYSKNQYEKALKLLTKTLIFHEEKAVQNKTIKGRLLHLLSLVLLAKYDLENARIQVQKAINIFQSIGDSVMVCKCIMIVGSTYALQYQYREALVYYFKALEGRDEKTEKLIFNFESAYYNIAHTYYTMRQYALAKAYFLRSLRLAKEKKRKSTIRLNMFMLGEILIRQEKYVEAEKTLLEVLEISEKQTASTFDKTSIFFYLGKLYGVQNEWKKANVYLEQAVSLRRELQIKADNWFVNFYLIVGGMYFSHEQWEKSIDYYKQALDENNEKITANKFHQTQIYGYLGDAYLQKGDLSQSLAYYQLAEQYWYIARDSGASKDHKILFNILSQLLVIYAKLFDKDNQIKYLETGSLLIPRINQAISEVRSSMFNEADSLRLNQAFVGFYRQALDFLYSYYGLKRDEKLLEEAFYIAEKKKVHRLLSDLKNAEALSLTHISIEKRKELQELQSKMVAAEKQLHQEAQQVGITNESALALLEIETTYHQLIKEIEQEHPEYLQSKRQLPSISIEELQQILKPQAAIVEYEITQKYLYIFCLTKEELTVKGQALPSNFEQQLDELIDNGILGLNRKKYVQTAYQLYQFLIASINSFLQSHHIQNLYIIPAAQLLELPFEALLTAPVHYKTKYTNLPYLLQSYTIQYHYSATLWAYQQKRTRKKASQCQAEFMGFAPVYGDGQIEDLPTAVEATRAVNIGGVDYQALLYSEKEVQDIHSSFAALGKTGQIHLRTDANLTTFKKNLQQVSAKYLHIAAHSVLSEEEEELVGILFSPIQEEELKLEIQETETLSKFIKRTASEADTTDIVLYPNEVTQLRLDSDLVFLSCCKSGVGKLVEGEGMLSINRSFIAAGVSNIVFTLFKIYDSKTPLLTQHFYEAVLKDGKSYSEALQYAKQQMIRLGIAPKFWSGFLLLGE